MSATAGAEAIQGGRRSRLRTFAWFAHRRRPPSEYEEIITLYCTWGVPFREDQDFPGLGPSGQIFLMNPDVTANHGYMKAHTPLQHSSWESFRDPHSLYYKTYNELQWASERTIDAVISTAERIGVVERLDADHVALLRAVWPALRYSEWAVVRALQDVGHHVPSSPICSCATLQLFDGLRHVQRNITHSLRLDRAHGGFTDHRRAWLQGAAWQPLRRLCEQLMAGSSRDWGETVVAQGVALKPLLSDLVYGALSDFSAARGDIVTAQLAGELLTDEERHIDWAWALVGFLVEDPGFGESNRKLIQGYLDTWLARAQEAVSPLAQLMAPCDGPQRLEVALSDQAQRLQEAGFSVPRRVGV